ncbi:SMI1/KNR4 family protein [Kitasatospora xanthocidica]|uniref:SMI1/KNR4 family protein n=1 Tax=Kitasatospora xanthocidica TaxID=83382 RepID=UPI0036F045D3
MLDYVALVASMMGEAPTGRLHHADWRDLEAVLGTELPEDFKEIVAAYAPIQLNGHLFLSHPNTQLFNLAKEVDRGIEAFKRINWQEGEARFRGEVPSFGGLGGLIPVAGTDRGEAVFLIKVEGATKFWHVVGFSDDGDHFYEYEMSFAEWLYRYLVGEDMIGPGSGVFYPGPLIIEDLPRSPGDRVVERRGPDRAM